MRKEILLFSGILVCMAVFTGFAMAVDIQGPGPISHNAQASAYVPGWMSLTVSPESINFVDDGTFPDLDTDLSPTESSAPVDLTVTIGPETNVDVNVGTSTNEAVFSTGGLTPHTFLVSYMDWLAEGSLYADYKDCTVQACLIETTEGSKTCVITNKLTIPQAQESGTYTTEIVITGRPGEFDACP